MHRASHTLTERCDGLWTSVLMHSDWERGRASGQGRKSIDVYAGQLVALWMISSSNGHTSHKHHRHLPLKGYCQGCPSASVLAPAALTRCPLL